jgi:hypothetical protein
MKRVLMMLCLLALPLAAQEAQKKEEPKPDAQIQKLFVLRYVDPIQLNRVLSSLGATTSYIPELKALTVSARPDVMANIEEAVKRLDVPTAIPVQSVTPKNLELVVYFLAGSQSGSSSSATAIPKDLEAVVAQLKNTFAYKSLRLMDSLTLRTRTGSKAETSGTTGGVDIGGTIQPIFTTFQIGSATIEGDQIRINGLRVNSKVPVGMGSFHPPTAAPLLSHRL